MTPNNTPCVKCFLGVASYQLSVDGLEYSHNVALLIDILMEVGAVVGIGTVDKSGAADGSRIAL